MYLQPIITQYFIDNKSEIWLLFLIAHSKGEDLTLLLIINSKRTSTWVVSSLFLAIRFRYSTFVLVYLICTAKVLIFV